MELDLQHPATLHLVGIGGAGMSGLARILVERGHTVTGSDLRESRNTVELAAMGAKIVIGHRADAVSDAEAVVASSAVGSENPELVAARARGIPVVPRAGLLAALMAADRRVLIAGTHGKTTTTSMVVVAAQAVGMDPSFSIGAQLNEVGTNAHAGDDPVFVAEADESDRSVLAYTPDIAVVTNADLDHPDAYASLDDVLDVFGRFLGNRRDGGVAILCVDDAGTRELARRATGRVITYGTDHRADVRLVPTSAAGGPIFIDNVEVATLDLAVLGHHNLLNATAALAVCQELGTDLAVAARGLGRFAGAARRYQVVGEVGGVTVVDDYAHHPTELRATLQAARQATTGRVFVVVQPHRFSRTRLLGAALGRAAAGADVVYVTDVYGSGEAPEPGVSGRLVAEGAEAAGARVHFQPHFAGLASELAAQVSSGDTVLVTGAGDVSQVAASLVRILRGGSADD